MLDDTTRPRHPLTRGDGRAYFVGGGIGSLAGAAFMIRDGGVRGDLITILEELPLSGGSMDGAGTDRGYVIRGGRMLNAPTYECTWDLFRTIPSLTSPGLSVFDETMAFSARVPTEAHARLVDQNRARLDVTHLGFSQRDRLDLLRLMMAREDDMGATRIHEWFSPSFFRTNFWLMWATTFAFQSWHSAAELRRYMRRFLHEFPRIHTLAGVTRTRYNQYDSMIRPLEAWLAQEGVRFEHGVRVLDVELSPVDGKVRARSLVLERAGERTHLALDANDLVFVTNGSMTDDATLGSTHEAPVLRTSLEHTTFGLWERLAHARPDFGRPRVFTDSVDDSLWESFTVTLPTRAFVDRLVSFTGNQPGTGALVTFKDSSWLMSLVLAHQPHFVGQPDDVQVFWGYGLFPGRVGNFVPKPMVECTGEEVLRELSGHLGFEPELTRGARTVPCLMPYITSQFMPRVRTDRPLPVPKSSLNLGFISQFVEIPDDVVFTVEYSVRAAQLATYELLGIARDVPRVTPHHRDPRVLLTSLRTAYR